MVESGFGATEVDDDDQPEIGIDARCRLVSGWRKTAADRSSLESLRRAVLAADWAKR